jgi:hypothetical protein
MGKSLNVRWVEVAVNQTDFVVLIQHDKAKIRSIIFDRSSGTSQESITLKLGNSTTLLTLKVANDYSREMCLSDTDVLGLKVSTSAQAHCWIGLVAEEHKGALLSGNNSVAL